MNNHNEINISPGTRICGIFGDPIEHSISPYMHNAAFRHMRMDFVYLPFRVKSANLKEAVEALRALNIRGVNVTIPHKAAVVSLLDDIDALAEEIGAVNTIVNEEGVLKGYNTDALGFLAALNAGHISVENKNILILGAGGACRAIAFVLMDRGGIITLMNRHLAPAEDLAGWLFNRFRRKIEVFDLNTDNVANNSKRVEILINTTSVGMSPLTNESLVPEGIFRDDLTVIDIIYNPVRTRLLREAEQKNALVMNGLEMLVWQGAAAFELWTGEKAPVDEMRQAAVKALEGYED